MTTDPKPQGRILAVVLVIVVAAVVFYVNLRPGSDRNESVPAISSQAKPGMEGGGDDGADAIPEAFRKSTADGSSSGSAAPASDEVLERLNILFMGGDQMASDDPSYDALFLVSINSDGGVAGVAPIPRNTAVDVEGQRDALGDRPVEEILSHVGAVFGVPVQYYVLIDFTGFTRMIDAMGGITIDVEEPIVYRNGQGEAVWTLEPGTHHLDGEASLRYLRYRPMSETDDQRTERQVRFLRALEEHAAEAQHLRTVPEWVRLLRTSVRTTLTVSALWELGRFVLRRSDRPLRIFRVEGTISDAHWHPVGDPDHLRDGLIDASSANR